MIFIMANLLCISLLVRFLLSFKTYFLGLAFKYYEFKFFSLFLIMYMCLPFFEIGSLCFVTLALLELTV